MKNIILLNNRSLHFYDFKELKKNYNLRISAVVFESSYKTLSDEIKENLDKIHVLPDINSGQRKFPSFPEDYLCSLIEEELIRFKETWIVAAEELDTFTVSRLRDKYKLPGTSSSIIKNYTNKVKQKDVLSQNNIRIPKFLPLSNKSDETEIKNIYNDFTKVLDKPFILKPINMGGTIGVEKINSYNSFSQYLRFNEFDDLIAEELINGQLYHCDFIIQNGIYIFAEVSEYLHNGLAFVKGYNHGSLLLKSDNSIRMLILEFCKKANIALGLTSGSTHFEVFVTEKEEIVFLEAAARPAGSMVPLVFSKMFEKNYLNAALLAEIQENVKDFNIIYEYYLWAMFPKKKGIVRKLKIPPLESFFHIDWYIKEKDFLPFTSSSIMEKAGTFLAYNKNYEILRRDFQLLRNFNAIEIY